MKHARVGGVGAFSSLVILSTTDSSYLGAEHNNDHNDKERIEQIHVPRTVSHNIFTGIIF